MKHLFVYILFFIFLPGALLAQFWGAKQPRSIDTPKDSLKKGEFTWAPELSPAGPILVTVSLDEQLAYTYRNGVLIGIATTSSGKPGHETPTGVFTVLMKDARHHSSKYNNASMPYTQRLTNQGISLHAGGLPGYPSSHGCIHLPSEYARLLFQASPMGMTVVVTNHVKFSEALNHPSFLSQVNKDGTVQPHERLSEKESFRWNPERSPQGPVTILISRADNRMVVMRNGTEIGRCKVNVNNEKDSLGTVLYIAHIEKYVTRSNGDSIVHTTLKWMPCALNDFYYGQQQHGRLEEQLARISIPAAFMSRVVMLVGEGTTMMITDAAILRNTTGVKLSVLTSSPESKKTK